MQEASFPPSALIRRIAEQYKQENCFFHNGGLTFPSHSAIIRLIQELQRLLFPGYLGPEAPGLDEEYFIRERLDSLRELLVDLLMAARHVSPDTAAEKAWDRASAEQLAAAFLAQLPEIKRLLLLDVQAAFDGDPAARCKEEIILSYPGFFAVLVYRLAHALYQLNVPLLPRMMTEYAHSKTGIDIHAGAAIGESFFMDHGTGIVIGETTQIGCFVKLYQGVTLGAISTRAGQQLAGVKRHPTIEDHVTIYSNASILGGATVIGRDSVIGGNAFITASVPPGTKIGRD